MFLLFQAGITTGYQEKPCLNPFDPDCPSTAPNRESRKVRKRI
jgi:patched 1 protein